MVDLLDYIEVRPFSPNSEVVRGRVFSVTHRAGPVSRMSPSGLIAYYFDKSGNMLGSSHQVALNKVKVLEKHPAFHLETDQTWHPHFRASLVEYMNALPAGTVFSVGQTRFVSVGGDAQFMLLSDPDTRFSASDAVSHVNWSESFPEHVLGKVMYDPSVRIINAPFRATIRLFKVEG